MSERKLDRLTKRLETTFTSGDQQYRGISSDLSPKGMFIRTMNAFVPGTVIDIELYLPDHTACRMRGKVRRAVKTPLKALKNGMGVEFTQTDPAYLAFLALSGVDVNASEPLTDRDSPAAARSAPLPDQGGPTDTEVILLTCPSCATTNRLPHAMLTLTPTCARCGVKLRIEEARPLHDKRRHRRYPKAIETRVSAGYTVLDAKTIDISEGGLFVSADKGFATGSHVEIDLYLPSGRICCIKGTVKRVADPSASPQGGMGIELINVTQESCFVAFLKEMESGAAPPRNRTANPAPPEESIIVACSACAAKNRVKKSKLAQGPKCGRCGAPLAAGPQT
jgi:Tfp pilus assembly protein PilZ